MKTGSVGWRIFAFSIIIIVLIALVISKLSGANFWLVFVVIYITVFINGWLAEWEDNQPGGFNNPSPPKGDSLSDHKEQ